jgi:hypothetical protein
MSAHSFPTKIRIVLTVLAVALFPVLANAQAPTIYNMSPTTGFPAGGTMVTIYGQNLDGATAVDFAGVPASNPHVVSDGIVTATTPPGNPGLAPVTVTTPKGTSTPLSLFSYLPLPPMVSSVSPPSGVSGGGTLVTISGANFNNATLVNFGSASAASFSVVSDGEITATTPPGTPRSTTVTVTTTGGTSKPGLFTYLGVSPSSGTPSGGTVVKIFGAGFTGATAVDFGSTPAASFNIVSATEITATAPPGTPGPTAITVTTPAGTTDAGPFTYIAIETCVNSGNILPPGSIYTDLRISDGITCTVDGSAPNNTYVYRHVNIWGTSTLKSTLAFEDKKINFHAHAILVENQGVLEAGMEAAVTSPISIWLYGSKDDGGNGIGCESGPTCGVPQAIWDSNPNVAMRPMVMPSGPCTPASNFDPTTPVGTDCFYQYEVLDDTDSPGAFFGKKVLAVSYGGILYLRGAKGIRDVPPSGPAIDTDPSDSGTSWVRLTKTIGSADAGTTKTLSVDRPVPTWAHGDQIVVTSTDYLPGHSEELTIDTVSTDATGTTITVTTPVQFQHWGDAYDMRPNLPDTVGPRDDPNRPKTQASRHLENRAAVALLSRNILVESEGKEPVLMDRDTGPGDPHFPVAAGYYGAQTLVRDGVAQFQVQGVEFDHLGAGGEIGHYPVHFHMVRKAPQPTEVPPFAGTYLADSSIHDSNTRFVTIHASQGILVARNVGYRSIGHGFYLEDATEINNRLYSNIGIEAIAAVNSSENTRRVPGILSQLGKSEQEVVPFHSDFDHPSIFWIMNTWNDFRYNVAVGAGTCGVCYWMLPGANSGYSVYETWDSYAAMQTHANAGIVPVMSFVGNSCSAAMTALQTVGDTSPCTGVQSADALADINGVKLQAIANPTPTPASAYPYVTNLRAKATVCDSEKKCLDPAVTPPCTGINGQEGNCAPSVIDHFSTSFNWAQFNDATVQLRGWWYLLTDSSITDVQSGGLQMITGGGYTRSDAPQGFWNLSRRNLFVGNTQPITVDANNGGGVPDNPFASNAGPFNPYALECPSSPYGSSFCVSKEQGIAFESAGFSNSQRFLNIYDGPTFEDSDAFADIHTQNIGTLEACRGSNGNTTSGICATLGWMDAYVSGVLQSPGGNKNANNCILPNAAISWKQPNGFYYPPAFDSRNLFFSDVAIRHFVIDPLFQPGGFVPNTSAAMNTYCTWQTTDFTNFTDVDRQTELTDLDGSLTGLLSDTAGVEGPTISVNNDPISDPASPLFEPAASPNFFNAPATTPECASEVTDGTPTVNTSAYEYVTTAVFPACLNNGSCPQHCVGSACTTHWGSACTNQACYGLPLYRQYLTGTEYTNWKNDNSKHPNIRMMGQSTGQRSNLTMNHGSYYIDTTVPYSVQMPTGGTISSPNVFDAGQTYYVYVLYAKPSLHQTYSFFIGTGLSTEAASAAVTTGFVNVENLPGARFVPDVGGSPDWIVSKPYNKETGMISVTIDLSGQTDVFANDRPAFCQPTTYCSVHADNTCGCKPGSSCTDDSVCDWGPRGLDCPMAGCFGFALTLPEGFNPPVPPATPTAPPAPVEFSADKYFADVSWVLASKEVAGTCHYEMAPPIQPSGQTRDPKGVR